MEAARDESFYWNCEYCDKEFAAKHEADEHEKQCSNKNLRRCKRCGLHKIKNPTHEYCSSCWKKIEDNDRNSKPEDAFDYNLRTNEVHTVYIMLYGKDKRKIGYSRDLNSRIIEIKRQFPENKFVYFREFNNESIALRFEAWLKNRSDRQLNKFISAFQDKIRKIESVY